MKCEILPLCFAIVFIILSFFGDAAFIGFRDSFFGIRNPSLALDRRQIPEPLKASTCGYRDGDANNARSAAPGFDCRFDVPRGIWGFCPTTVISATDCGLAAACVDSNGCKSGCGRLNDASANTFFCTVGGEEFCSTARLIVGPDQTFDYLACAVTPKLEILRASPTTTSSPKTKTLEPDQTPTPQLTPDPVTVTATPSAIVVTERPDPEPTDEVITHAPNVTTPTSAPETDTGDGEDVATRAEDSTGNNLNADTETDSKAPLGTEDASGVASRTRSQSSSSRRPSDAFETSEPVPASDSSPNKMPVIIGGAVGGGTAFLLLAFLVWFLVRSRKRKLQSQINTEALPPVPPKRDSRWPGAQEVEGDAKLHGHAVMTELPERGQQGWGRGGEKAELPGHHRWNERNSNGTMRYELPADNVI